MTSRMTTDYPFTTWVTVDGTQIPCTAADLGAGKPTILDGLTFTWGRQSTVDQPDTETCAFTIREQLADAVTTLDTIHVGSDIEIWTEGQVIPSQAETMTETGFPVTGPLDPMRWTRRSGDTPTVTVSRAPSRAWNAAWLAVPGSINWSTTLAFPPAPFEAAGTNPGAWDAIPRLLPGQTWNFTAQVWVPSGVTVNLAAYGYTGPHTADVLGACVIGPPASPTDTGDRNTAVGNWQWRTLAGTIRLSSSQTDPAGYWVAAAIGLVNMPTRTTWAQTPGLWSDQTLRWLDYNQAGISFLSITHDTASVRDVLVWSGQVTSLVSQAAGDKAYTTAVTCADISAALANLKVGDVPWPVESVQARANHILALVPTAPPITIDSALRPIHVSFRDVDAQPPLGLLQDLAQTAGGVMWVTAHATQGVYLWMEDIDNRAAVRRFIIDPDTGLVTIGPNVASEDIAILSARDILRDPVAWTQDVSVVITQVSVGWLEQVTVDGQPSTNDHTEIVQAAPADVNLYGVRDLSVSTELTAQTDAVALAGRLLSQSENTGWLATGFTLDTVAIERDIPTVDYATRVDIIMDLLDATDRIGMAVTLIDLPVWTPADSVSSMYVEGGTYTWADYRWQLDLTASPAAGQGESATWADFNSTTVRWADFDRTITWQDAYGTAGPQ